MIVVKKGLDMRIVAGKAKGTKLYTLEGENTRPTLDRVKESLFNIIQNDIQDSIFLDLFSGSGAIGLEAISRGAKKAILCDKSKEACMVIRKNIEKTHALENTELYQADFKEVLTNRIHEKLDIIFLDPPYKTDFAIEALKMLMEKDLLKDNTMIIIETDDSNRILENLKNINCEIKDVRKYGRAYLIFLRGV